MNTMSMHSQIRQRRFRQHVLARLGRGWADSLSARLAEWRFERAQRDAERRAERETRVARTMADRYEASDRGFSADLRAAVARHELAAVAAPAASARPSGMRGAPARSAA